MQLSRSDRANRNVEDILSEQGFSCGNLHYEVFESENGTLIFGSRLNGSPIVFSSDSFDEILNAIHTLDGKCRASFLAKLNGRFIMIVYLEDISRVPVGLYEFVSPEYTSANALRYITEHGKVLTGPSAVEKLSRVFEL